MQPPPHSGPPSCNPDAHKLYSNLAACYTKLGAYPEGVKAADRCIELAPDFAKGYSRKGTLQFLMKEYNKVGRARGRAPLHALPPASHAARPLTQASGCRTRCLMPPPAMHVAPPPQALATYEAGLKHDSENAELRDGAMRCVEAMNRMAQGQGSEEELAATRAKAMEDPEIQGILRDPVMQQVGGGPSGAQGQGRREGARAVG